MSTMYALKFRNVIIYRLIVWIDNRSLMQSTKLLNTHTRIALQNGVWDNIVYILKLYTPTYFNNGPECYYRYTSDDIKAKVWEKSDLVTFL
jgi:hypothetical protein